MAQNVTRCVMELFEPRNRVEEERGPLRYCCLCLPVARLPCDPTQDTGAGLQIYTLQVTFCTCFTAFKFKASGCKRALQVCLTNRLKDTLTLKTSLSAGWDLIHSVQIPGIRLQTCASSVPHQPAEGHTGS